MKSLNKRQLLALCMLVTAFITFSFKSNVIALKRADVKPTAPKIEPKKLDISFDNIEFDFNRSSIRKESYVELNNVVKALKENKASIRVSGHADSKGTYLYNWNLSKKRAESVKAYLVKNGAEESHVAATEFGDTKPIASNSTPQGRQKNRRAELTIF
jgi:OOP family OmpA-OmpF porin